MSVAFIMVLILTIARLWIGLQLFLTARKSHISNLYWLAAVFGLAVSNIFTPLPGTPSPIENAWAFNLGFLAGHICLSMFIHTTFYRGRKSPLAIVVGIFVIALLAIIYFLSINNLKMATIVAGVSLVNWVWHIIVARSAYLAIANDPIVEKWIKSRYILMMVYVVMIAISSGMAVLSSINLVPPAIIPFNILLVIGSIILQFLVWVMPEPFRRWLNRTQQQLPVLDKEPQPRSVMDVFGTAMTTDTGLNTIACFYAIRSSIAKKIGTQDSDAIQRHINVMTFYDWDAVLQHAELNRILINGGADKNSAAKAVENARRALVEKQSLITLSTR